MMKRNSRRLPLPALVSLVSFVACLGGGFFDGPSSSARLPPGCAPRWETGGARTLPCNTVCRQHATRRRHRFSSMRVLSVIHEPGPTGGGGLFEDLVEERGDALVPLARADARRARAADRLRRRDDLRWGHAPRPGRRAPLAPRGGGFHPRGARRGSAAPRRLPRGAADRTRGRRVGRAGPSVGGRLVPGRAQQART